MKVLFDLQGAQTNGSKNRGIGNYTINLVTALADLESNDFSISTISNYSLDQEKLNHIKSINNKSYGNIKFDKYNRYLNNKIRQLNREIIDDTIDYLSPQFVIFSSIFETDEVQYALPTMKKYGAQTVSSAIIYDIIPYLFSSEYLPDENSRTSYNRCLRAALKADHLFSISHCTKKDLIDNFSIDPERISVIGAGVDLKKFRTYALSKNDFFLKYKINKPYLLFIGGDEYRKNLIGFLKYFVQIEHEKYDKYDFLMLGKISEHNKNAIIKLFEQNNISPSRAIFVQFIDAEDISSAYKYADLFIFPSLYEGFGLPLIEALAARTPAICSDNSSLKEIVNDKKFRFNPNDIDDIRRAFEYAKSSSSCENLFQDFENKIENFTWLNCAKLMKEAILKQPPPKQNTIISNAELGNSNIKLLLNTENIELSIKVIEKLEKSFPVQIYSGPEKIRIYFSHGLEVFDLARFKSNSDFCLNLYDDFETAKLQKGHQSIWQNEIRILTKKGEANSILTQISEAQMALYDYIFIEDKKSIEIFRIIVKNNIPSISKIDFTEFKNNVICQYLKFYRRSDKFIIEKIKSIRENIKPEKNLLRKFVKELSKIRFAK